MKKRILTLLAAVCLLSAVLSGCGDGSQNGMTGTTDQSTANTQTEGPAARAAAGELNVGIAQDLDSSLCLLYTSGVALRGPRHLGHDRPDRA